MFFGISILCLLLGSVSAVPSASIFLQRSYFDKALQTTKSTVFGMLTSFRHNGRRGDSLSATYSQCSVTYGDLTLELPPVSITEMSVEVLSTEASVVVSFPSLASFNTSVSQFGTNCSTGTGLTSILSNTLGSYYASIRLSSPLAWKITFGSNASIVNALLVPNLTSSYMMSYETGTGFVLDVFLQSYFTSITESIRSALEDVLQIAAMQPLTIALNASTSIALGGCNVTSSNNSLQFVLNSTNCTADWSGLQPSFAASDIALRMPYFESFFVPKNRAIPHDACTTCCIEPCPPPIYFSQAQLQLEFTSCVACFEAVESAATNVSFLVGGV